MIERMKNAELCINEAARAKPHATACVLALYFGEKFDSAKKAKLDFGVPPLMRACWRPFLGVGRLSGGHASSSPVLCSCFGMSRRDVGKTTRVLDRGMARNKA